MHPVFAFIYNFIVNFILSGLNKRSVIGLPLNFFINFSPVFTWLLIFKNANLIPNSIRPPIHVKLAKNLDEFMFDPTRFSAWLSLVLLVCLSYLIWFQFYKNDRDSIKQLVSQNNNNNNNNHNNNGQSYNLDDDMDIETQQIRNSTVKLLNSITFMAPLLLALSWILLNITHSFISNIHTFLDLTAWCSYVLFHFFNPLFTAIYLYVFQYPGALKYFSCSLGLQNVLGVIIHLVFPNAPPWFIHLYSEDAAANYDMEGYAAGLTRVDVKLGTHLNSNGFHKSPIVFGALPSLHSAMAVLGLFFVCYHTRWVTPKVLMFAFVNLQWWSTMYLDHHWRLDLIAGLLLSILSFTIFKRFLIKKEKEFVQKRLANSPDATTMGMRVFRNTRFEKFFDPLR